MNEVAQIRPNQMALFSPKQLELIRKTVAADCNVDEFDLFMEIAKSRGLNPFLKQIYCFVYSKDDAKKRKMSVVTAIDGYRIIAARCRDYRPSDVPTEFETDENLKSSENPAGIIRAIVKGFKYGPDGKWYPVVGEAVWDEYAPLVETSEEGFEWIDTGEVWQDSGKPKKKKVPKNGSKIIRVPDNLWNKMPHGQLAKCAEAQMLRKGWPEDFSGVYVAEELDRARNEDFTASEAVQAYEVEKRLRLTGGNNAIVVQWTPDSPLEQVPLGQFADRAAAFVTASTSLPDLDGWEETNRTGLKDFWAKAKTDALELKKILETKKAALAQAAKA